MATVTVSITSEDESKVMSVLTRTDGEGENQVKVVDITVQNGRGGPKDMGTFAVCELKDFAKSL